MFHLVAHAFRGTRLFNCWEEACALWQRLARVPGLRALVLMPDHVHLLSSSGDAHAFDAALRAYAQWRNHRRGVRGRVWEARPPPEALPDRKHARRTLRYVHLNPCRSRLVACPAAWPFSTHRDALGLALSPVREKAPDPVDLHRYISSDPSACVTGTPFPGDALRMDRPDLQALAGAVSELARVPLTRVFQRSPERQLFVGAARALTSWSGVEIARVAGVHPSQVARAGWPPRQVNAKLVRMLADERFPGLAERDPRLRRR